jgi:hypothetical protein
MSDHIELLTEINNQLANMTKSMNDLNNRMSIIERKTDDINDGVGSIDIKTTAIHKYVPFVGWLEGVGKNITNKLLYLNGVLEYPSIDYEN